MGDAQVQHAVGVDAAGHCAVAGRNAHGHRFAGDCRGVQTADTLNDHAVERDAVARTDKQQVVDLRVRGGHGLGAAVG